MGRIEVCINFGPMRPVWLPWLARDALFTHPVLFSISVADSFLGQRPLEPRAQYHMGQTLAFLNQRLSDKTLALDDSTIFVVIALIIFSTHLRDYTTAMIHMKGLARMVELRGGLENLRHNSRLYTKLIRCVPPTITINI